MLITEEYKKLNKTMHDEKPAYGTSGIKWADSVINMADRINSQDVLDYGCGKSTLANNLPFDINEYDPCIPGKDDAPEPADIVVCTDVLEHIEPESLDAVLNDLHRLTKKVCLLTIHNGPAQKTLPDGRNAHLIQEDERFWLGAILARFQLWSYIRNQGVHHKEDFNVLEYVVYCTPRPEFQAKRI